MPDDNRADTAAHQESLTFVFWHCKTNTSFSICQIYFSDNAKIGRITPNYPQYVGVSINAALSGKVALNTSLSACIG